FESRRPAEVRESFHAIPVCLVDDRAIHLRLELRHAAFTVVNPELDEMNAPGLQLPNVLAALFWRRCAVRNACARFARRPRHWRRRDAFSNGQEFCRIR